MGVVAMIIDVVVVTVEEKVRVEETFRHLRLATETNHPIIMVMTATDVTVVAVVVAAAVVVVHRRLDTETITATMMMIVGTVTNNNSINTEIKYEIIKINEYVNVGCCTL